jgi:N6-L-threonylcarbamoyladenine synthase
MLGGRARIRADRLIILGGEGFGNAASRGGKTEAMFVLGIETTCDETAAAVVYRNYEGRGEIRSNVVLSQLEEHRPYGGVVPEIAARAHVEHLDRIIKKAMDEGGLAFADLDGIAAAAGPGLIGGVIVGLTTAKAIALGAGKPLIAVNHLEAHALTARLTDGLAFPYLLLLVSGGHTQLVAVEDVGRYRLIGGTVDDAVGEAFDKTAKMLGLPYPGGPEVERLAEQGDPRRFELPRPMLGRPEPDFSLSGLKTAVRLEAERTAPLSNQDVADLCASFQAAVVDVVLDRVSAGLAVMREAKQGPSALVVAGGVAVNRVIRDAMQEFSDEIGMPLVLPPPELCTDNGAMIAWAGAERLARGMTDGFDTSPRARWPLDNLAGGAKGGARG